MNPADTAVPAVLFVCVHNAGRSQMAAGFLRTLGADRVRVLSAGSEPADALNPVAVEAMAEVGIDIAAAQPAVLSPDDVRASDVVITMGCGDACPIFPGKRYEDWALVDPVGQPLEVVRAIRDEIRDRVVALLDEIAPAPDGSAGECCAPASEPEGSCCAPAPAAEESCCASAPEPEPESSCCAPAPAAAPAPADAQPAPEAHSDLPVVVIGAGPVGLAAAAHLSERGLPFLVLEAGDRPAAAVRAWGHVRLFSPWRYNVDAAARRLLEPRGWKEPDADDLPTGAQLADAYLDPLAAVLGDRVRTGTQVIAISREGIDRTRTAGRVEAPLLVRIATDRGVEDISARAVIDASGTWGHSNPVGASGLPADGEAEAAAAGRITSPLPDALGSARSALAGARVLVVGAGHSAANALLDLAALGDEHPGGHLTWAVRGTDLSRVFGGGDADELEARGALGTRLRALVDSGRVDVRTSCAIRALTENPDGLRVDGADADGEFVLTVDAVVPATGFRADLSILEETRLDMDSALGAPRRLAPLIDPELHSCGSVDPHGERVLAQPEPGLYIVGAKSYGRAPTFLMATGFEQVRSIVAALAGDRAAADDVQLDLPETGVCSVDLAAPDAAECCG